MGIDNSAGNQERKIRTLSEVMAENRAAIDRIDSPYKQVGLKEYESGADSPYDDSRLYFPGAGWKFHLNIAPCNVKQVARELKTLGVHHKYLKGGEIDAGKIFTIYTGSKRTTEIAVRLVFARVGHLLEEPVKGNGETLFAPRIEGRFEGEDKDYHRKVCRDGICMHRGVWSWGTISDQQVMVSKRMLQNQYGDYFGGGIEYFDPKKGYAGVV